MSQQYQKQKKKWYNKGKEETKKAILEKIDEMCKKHFVKDFMIDELKKEILK